MKGEGLDTLIDSSEAVAFDVFDTLVTRPFMRPDHLFHFMENKHRSPGFSRRRVSAERRARRTIRPEVDLDEIYSLLPEFRDMKDLELAEELALCVPDPGIREFWDHAVASGRPVVLISDMYLPSEHIARMLEKCGFTGWSRLYVSHEHSAGKCDGSLYDIVLSDLGVSPSSLLMVGDNRHSDVEVPSGRGIRTRRWIPMRERYGALHPVELRRASRDPAISLLAGLDMLLDRPGEDYWHSVGRRFAGPLVTMFGLFILRNEGDCDRIVFCSRDGHMAMRAYEALGGTRDHVYLHTSRYLTRILSGTCLDGDRWLELVSDYLEHVHGDEFGFDLEDPEMIRREEKWIRAVLEKDARDYDIHVRRTVGDAERIMMVDSTTLRFTAQRDLEARLGRKVRGCYYTVSKRSDVDHVAYAERDGEHLTWSHVNLSEFFLSSDEAPLRGLVNGVPTMMEPNGHEKERISHCREMQEGMMEYIADFRRFFGDDMPLLDHVSVDRWLDVLVRNERMEEGPLWNTPWPSDITNTEYSDLIFRPRDIVGWAKSTAGAILRRS